MRTPRAVAAALVVAHGLVGCAAGGETTRESATVDRVIDGDTLGLRGGSRVRLVQIDAPEAAEECYGRAATLELVRLAPPGTQVVLEPDPRLDREDRFGRLLRYVRVGSSNVNIELVRRGAAAPYFFDGVRGRYAKRLLDAVAAARSGRRGMWGLCRVSWNPERQVLTRPR